MNDTAPLLIELGTDELPVNALPGLARAFLDGVQGALARRGIAFQDGARPLYTPRRLSVLLDGVATVQPERFRLGPLVQLLCQELPARARALPVAGHRMEIRGHAVLVDGGLRPVPPAGMSLLRALSRRPGWVVSRAELLRALPGTGRDEHAVETAMARLRSALGAPKLIQTVVKRGYRLALDPTAESGCGDG